MGKILSKILKGVISLMKFYNSVKKTFTSLFKNENSN